MTSDDVSRPEGRSGGPDAGAPADRRGERRKRAIPVALDRRGKERERTATGRDPLRRRQVDPTTCEKDYSDDEIEFMKAMDRYKRDNGRPFPAWSEVLQVLHSLGYRRVAEPTDPLTPPSPPGGERVG
jgi:hypothetical protein